MDVSILLIALLAALAGALVAALLARAGSRGGDGLAVARLAESADKLAVSQSVLADRVRQVEARVDERLDAVAKRLGEGLSQQTEKTGETLKALHERLAVIDAAQRRIADLSSQVVGLQDILSNKQARGAFGQTRLEDIVTDALPAAAYEFEATLSNGKRVDCLVRLPHPPGPVAIDSKFPLEAYRALADARDESSRRQAERAFQADVLKHVADIADKYVVAGETADWALMFVPSEAVYGETHAHFPRVVEKALRQRVAIVSPNTLMGLLATVRAVMRDAETRKQADRIQAEVEKMLGDVRRLDDRAQALRQHFDLADRDIEEIAKSTRKIVRSGDKIREVRLEDEGEDARPPLEPPAAGA
jgi:DNA recombination protein RmuC